MTIQNAQTMTIDIDRLATKLEPMLRRIIHEELSRLLTEHPGVFYLEPDTPLYQDMEAIARRSKKGQLKLYTHEEVWNEQIPSGV